MPFPYLNAMDFRNNLHFSGARDHLNDEHWTAVRPNYQNQPIIVRTGREVNEHGEFYTLSLGIIASGAEEAPSSHDIGSAQSNARFILEDLAIRAGLKRIDAPGNIAQEEYFCTADDDPPQATLWFRPSAQHAVRKALTPKEELSLPDVTPLRNTRTPD